MTLLRNVTIAYNFDHKQGIDPTFDYISDTLLNILSEDCGLAVLSEQVHVNSITELPQGGSSYTSLREHYSQPEPIPASAPYTSMRSLAEGPSSQSTPYSRYTL